MADQNWHLITHYNFLGCWLTAAAGGAPPLVPAPAGIANNCVTGSSGTDGKWSNVACTGTSGSICERDGETTPAPPPASGSTCLESGTAVLLGMLFFCYQ